MYSILENISKGLKVHTEFIIIIFCLQLGRLTPVILTPSPVYRLSGNREDLALHFPVNNLRA